MPQQDTPPPGGAYIRELRNSRDWNQTKLGQAIGYTRDNEVRGFELGTRDPSIRDLHNIRRELQLTSVEWQELLRRFNILEDIPPAMHTPDPLDWFQNYRLGNIELPVMNLFGSPATPFSIGEVTIDYKPVMYHTQPGYPAALLNAKPFLLEGYFQEYGHHFVDNTLPRLSGYMQTGETVGDQRGTLTLHFMLTDFFTFLATNRSLDRAVIPRPESSPHSPRNQTIREAYVAFPYELETSKLSNPLGVQVVVISRNSSQSPNDQVFIRFRGQKVALHRNRYQPAAAGYFVLDHRDAAREVPSPFVTAVTEAQQEIADRLILSPADYKLIGVAIRWEDMEPNAYGYIETSQSVKDILGDFRRDAYEGVPVAIPFEPRSVLTHLTQYRWESVGALAMCAALLAHFPHEDIEAIARTLPPKHFREFFEQHEELQKEVDE